MDGGFYRGNQSLYDVVLSCKYKAHLVEYTWFNSSVHNVTHRPFPNGTLSELWHATHVPSSVDGGSATMQTLLRQAAVQPSSIAFADSWAKLYSPTIMAVAGGLSSGRANESEQTRTPILVIKVYIPVLALLGFCCMSYIVAGFVLTVLALRSKAVENIADAKARIGIFGLADWAYSAWSTEQSGLLCKEKKIGSEGMLVGILGDSRKGYHYTFIPDDDRRLDSSRLGNV